MEQRLNIRDDAVSWTTTDDDHVVILDLRTSRYLSLNASAARLWTRLAEGATRFELVDDLTDNYGLHATTAEHDVSSFLVALTERQLIKPVE